ncbi:MAG TPA: S4 domain-containing protein [Roseiarcus sp.]
MTENACRIDVWLCRARFFKTRSLAARIVEDGGMRLLRGQARAPVDKPSRTVRCGDVLSFAQGPKWVAVRVEALGERRGPAPEARTLYSALTDAGGDATSADVAPNMTGRALEGRDFNHTRG